MTTTMVPTTPAGARPTPPAAPPHQIGRPVVRRGDIWHVADGPRNSVGSENWADRPAVVVSATPVNQITRCVQVVFLSARHQDVALRSGQVAVPRTGALQSNSVALCHQIHPVDLSRLTRRLGEVDDDTLEEIGQNLRQTLSLD